MTAHYLHFMFEGPCFRIVSYLESSKLDDKLRNAVIS